MTGLARVWSVALHGVDGAPVEIAMHLPIRNSHLAPRDSSGAIKVDLHYSS